MVVIDRDSNFEGLEGEPSVSNSYSHMTYIIPTNHIIDTTVILTTTFLNEVLRGGRGESGSLTRHPPYFGL